VHKSNNIVEKWSSPLVRLTAVLTSFRSDNIEVRIHSRFDWTVIGKLKCELCISVAGIEENTDTVFEKRYYMSLRRHCLIKN